MALFTKHPPISSDQVCIGNSSVIVTGHYNVGTLRLCIVKVLAVILDANAPSNIDYGEFTIFFRRFNNGVAIIRSVADTPFSLPGTLAGSTVGSRLINGPAGNGNTIETIFTNPPSGNRSIRVIADFSLTTIQD